MTLNFNGRRAYVRRDRINLIKRVDGIVFDCDGVLIDIRNSYNLAISKSAAYILGAITGRVVPESLISDEIIFLFRKSGGFNNDWDTVYGILMFTLSSLPKGIRDFLTKLMEKFIEELSPYRRLTQLKEAVGKELDPCMLDDEFFVETIRRMKGFAKILDSTGKRSVDKNLMETFGNDENFRRFYALLKQFLHPSEDVRKSIIARVFEEFFCGVSLFKEIYGVPPQFHTGSGLIENETLIVRPETLDSLISILGKRNLGIASGSRRKSAEYVLGELIDKFNPEALIFAETVEMAELECTEKSLKKPHPFSLLKAAEGFEDCNILMYVGDSAEDLLMALEAARLRGEVLFAGVYCYTGLEEKIVRSFLDYGCDMIIPSVNELPLVLEKLREEKYS